MCMRRPQPQPTVPLPMLSPLPGWIVSGTAETVEAAAFRSGAALAHLTFVTAAADLPQALWRDRLALAAAEVCAGFAGHREGACALRDALHSRVPATIPAPQERSCGNGRRLWRDRSRWRGLAARWMVLRLNRSPSALTQWGQHQWTGRHG